jgi:hypothetical protein
MQLQFSNNECMGVANTKFNFLKKQDPFGNLVPNLYIGIMYFDLNGPAYFIMYFYLKNGCLAQWNVG